MEPGDFVLWDSRTVHYGATPLEQKKRFAICWSPHSYPSLTDLELISI